MKAPSELATANQRKEHQLNIEKYIQWVRQHDVADSTGIYFIRILLLLPSKSANSCEILWKFKLIGFKVIQGHLSWCQSKAHMQLPT